MERAFQDYLTAADRQYCFSNDRLLTVKHTESLRRNNSYYYYQLYLFLVQEFPSLGPVPYFRDYVVRCEERFQRDEEFGVDDV